MSNRGISVIIPTLNGGALFEKCIDKLRRQQYPGEIQLIVVDSGSTDNTLEHARNAGARIECIEQKNFHHARTRNQAIAFSDSDKVVFTVQDAVPLSDFFLSRLEKALEETDSAAAYARQIPHEDAHLFARFEVEYHSRYLGNAPVVQSIESPESVEHLEYDTLLRKVRLDNVCAVYRKERLLECPFPEVDFGEDMAWALKNMLQGHKISYRPDIQVCHSHSRPAEYRFRRAIIDSISCARILNRVRDDLSGFGVPDLMALTESVGAYARKRKAEISAGDAGPSKRGAGADVIRQVMEKYSLQNRIRKFLFSRIGKAQGLKSAAVSLWDQAMKNHIDHVLSLISERYPGAAEADLLDAIDHAAASVTGRVYGEVYSSCLLKGEVPPAIENFIRPYLSGV